MTPAPRKPRLRTIRASLVLRIDPAKWTETYGTPPEEVDEAAKRYVVTLVNDSAARQHGAIVTARRAT